MTSLRVAPRADDDHPASCRCASQLIEPVTTGCVVEVSNHNQRSEVGVPNRRLCAGSATFDACGKAIQFQMHSKLRCAIHFRVEQQNWLVTCPNTPDLHFSSLVTTRWPASSRRVEPNCAKPNKSCSCQ